MQENPLSPLWEASTHLQSVSNGPTTKRVREGRGAPKEGVARPTPDHKRNDMLATNTLRAFSRRTYRTASDARLCWVSTREQIQGSGHSVWPEEQACYETSRTVRASISPASLNVARLWVSGVGGGPCVSSPPTETGTLENFHNCLPRQKKH